MNSVLEIIKRINITSPVLVREDMKKHTTFKTGGEAEVFIKAHNIDDIKKVTNICKEKSIPLFILGGGANILVSDKGIPGVTLFLGELADYTISNSEIVAQAGISVNTMCEAALDHKLSGLEYIYGMPGSLGGALWMNARCYGEEISDSFLWGEYINSSGEIIRIEKDPQDWDYKKSPFQIKDIVILRAAFKLKESEPDSIKEKMMANFKDRRDKGHFKYPCAGSVFKNNRDFGAPSGKIIEDCGIKGLTKGGAQISEFHGNIIVNRDNATSSDINYLIETCIDKVKEKFGFQLEPEVLKVGNWE